MKNIIGIFFFMFLCLSSAQEEKRLALVVGNANYDKGELKNPVNDARLIASTLDSLNCDFKRKPFNKKGHDSCNKGVWK